MRPLYDDRIATNLQAVGDRQSVRRAAVGSAIVNTGDALIASNTKFTWSTFGQIALQSVLAAGYAALGEQGATSPIVKTVLAVSGELVASDIVGGWNWFKG